MQDYLQYDFHHLPLPSLSHDTSLRHTVHPLTPYFIILWHKKLLPYLILCSGRNNTVYKMWIFTLYLND
jgi:hypothetical protein